MHSQCQAIAVVCVKRLGIAPLVAFLFRQIEKDWSAILPRKPSLKLFAYKLGYLCNFLSQKKPEIEWSERKNQDNKYVRWSRPHPSSQHSGSWPCFPFVPSNTSIAFQCRRVFSNQFIGSDRHFRVFGVVVKCNAVLKKVKIFGHITES